MIQEMTDTKTAPLGDTALITNEIRETLPHKQSLNGYPRHLSERYTWMEVISNSPNSTVTLAFDKKDQKFVAIKELVLHDSKKKSEVKRRMREGIVTKKMQENGGLEVLDHHIENSSLFLILEHIDPEKGETFKEYLLENKLTEKEVLHFGERIGKKIESFWEKLHLLHLDLKPGNIFKVGDDIKIFDFGISNLATINQDYGTAQYLSPERIFNVTDHYIYSETLRKLGYGPYLETKLPITIKSEVFSFALIIYEFFTSTPLIDVYYISSYPEILKGSNSEYIQQKVTSLSQKLRPNDANAQKRIEKVFLKALSQDPNMRQASPVEFMNDLKDALGFPTAPTSNL